MVLRSQYYPLKPLGKLGPSLAPVMGSREGESFGRICDLGLMGIHCQCNKANQTELINPGLMSRANHLLGDPQEGRRGIM